MITLKTFSFKDCWLSSGKNYKQGLTWSNWDDVPQSRTDYLCNMIFKKIIYIMFYIKRNEVDQKPLASENEALNSFR